MTFDHGKSITIKKSDTLSNKFRNTQTWRNKRKSVLMMDKELCQLCIRNLYNTQDRRSNNLLIEVHHIEPIIEAYELRLDESNLNIIMCKSS